MTSAKISNCPYKFYNPDAICCVPRVPFPGSSTAQAGSHFLHRSFSICCTSKTSAASMSNVCQTCGVVGWEVAQIYCDNCSDFFVHRYCLENMPPTFDEYVVWFCEDCKPAAKVSPLPEIQSEDCFKPSPKASPLPEVYPDLELEYVTAQPIIDPIWRGRLNITDPKRDSSYRLVAHLSRIACSRVFEEARLFPESLSSQISSRLSVWPKGFPKNGPKDEHIGLYFFPEARTDRQAFNGLLGEMVRRDLALRVVVTNAELLIFSSTKLPQSHWRFQGSLYLWGVFRNKQAADNSPG